MSGKKELYEEKFLFNGWIYKIMYNIFIDNTRSSFKNNMQTFDDILPYEHFIGAFEEEETDLEYIELQKIISKMKKDVDKNRFELFLKYSEGWEYKNLAKKFKISMSKVKSDIFKTRKILKNKYSKYEFLQK